MTSLTAVRSRAVSPAHSVSDYASMERRILNYIQERDFNSAFQQVCGKFESSYAICLSLPPFKFGGFKFVFMEPSTY